MIVCLLTDYGRDDEFVGVCHGVIRTIAPDAQIVDVTHGVPSFDVRRGALTLRDTLTYMPVGVHVAIVDPGVGGERRAVALRTADGRLMVGPDNGLLSLAWEAAGDVELAVDVSRSRYRLEPVSATFHGRDVFAPVAAQLAAGARLADAGEALDPTALERLELPEPRSQDGALVAHVLAVDRFGNVSLNAGNAELAGAGLELAETSVEPDAPPIEVEVAGGSFAARRATTFADVAAGELILYEDSRRSLALAINRGDAAATLGIAPDAEVRLRSR